jgi:hypothetical protein
VSNVYLDLTQEFNAGRLRAVISSGQAAVLHRLAVMSKDGDWILREDSEATSHVLGVLGHHGARYRFGAPLDVRWLEGGWSAHFEFVDQGIRVRADFVTRPPRIDPAQLEQLWTEQSGRDLPFVNARQLAEIKKTNREKDYAVIGELARLMRDPAEKLLYSRSARDLIALASEYPALTRTFSPMRPLLRQVGKQLEPLEAALDAERRALIHANERRLAAYRAAATRWTEAWPAIEKEIRNATLPAAHDIVVRRALDCLPFKPEL